MQNNLDKPLCDHCGQTLEHFLNQMEEHNLEVVCPSCGKVLVGGSQETAAGESDGERKDPNPPAKTASNDSSANRPLSQKKH